LKNKTIAEEMYHGDEPFLVESRGEDFARDE